jgi:hypothetical protein
MVYIGEPVNREFPGQPVNLALNLDKKGNPIPSASINSIPDSLYQAIDGKIWYFPEIRNRWTTTGSTSTTDWYALDFEKPKEISTVKLYLFSDGKRFLVPDNISIDYKIDDQWKPVSLKETIALTGNTSNTISFDKINAETIRINIEHKSKQVVIAELECY